MALAAPACKNSSRTTTVRWISEQNQLVAGGLIFFVQHGVCNQLIQRDFFENIGFYEVQKNLWRDRQAMVLDGDQHEQIRAYGDPDLRLHGVDRIAEEVLDRQILAIKRAAGEAEYGQPLPIINTFIDSELTRLESVLPPLPRDTDFAVLDRLLKDTVLRMDEREDGK